MVGVCVCAMARIFLVTATVSIIARGYSYSPVIIEHRLRHTPRFPCYGALELVIVQGIYCPASRREILNSSSMQLWNLNSRYIFKPYQFDFMFLRSGGSRFCELGKKRKNLIKPVNSTSLRPQCSSHLNCSVQQTEYSTILSYRTTVCTVTACRATACTWSYSSETKKSTTVWCP